MTNLISPGDKFGRWTVIQKAPSRDLPSGGKRPYWLCRCECGAAVEVQAPHLRSGRSASCGCLRVDMATERALIHGGRDTKLYDVWTQMLQRCENPKNRSYDRYGGRGIKVCARWHSFASFRDDMNVGYAPGLQIDRENNDGHYTKRNCHWATNKANSRNKRKTIRVLWEGKRVALADLADQYGVKLNTAYSRYKLKGWSVRRAIGLE